MYDWNRLEEEHWSALVEAVLGRAAREAGEPPRGDEGVLAKLSRAQQVGLQAVIGTGDVLAAVSGALVEDLTQFLEAEFLSDLYSRLEAIQSDPERRIPLARVFVDLPTDKGGDFCAQLGALPPRFDTRADPHRFMLVGGPGQGKTTLGQQLCQLHRAVLLEPRIEHLGPDAEGQVGALLRQAEHLRPLQRRFPIRVPLHRFAAEFPQGQDPLWTWVLARFRLQLGRDIPAAPLREFLQLFPLLLVLDGLDEVPASANRDVVVRAVEDFLQGLPGADVVAVASTRPQGYRGELGWPDQTLRPLKPEQARGYAERLIKERNRNDRDRQGVVTSRFVRALEDPQAAALTRSPLQVTILCALLERQADAPKLRWSLFSDYFQVIYNRERDRELPSTRILGEHPDLVRRLHWELGYLLHLRGELAEGEEGLSRAALEAVVGRLLQERGFKGEEAEQLRGRIVEAALLRLVFLVGLADERVGFEIRSLQEYAAAERLVEAEGPVLEDRLYAIARSVHWRNVFAFAAGHGEAIYEPLVQAVERVLGRCPEEAPLLAAELLAEGVGGSRPARRQMLMERAVTGLSGPLAGRIVEVLAQLSPGSVVDAPRLSIEGWEAAVQAELSVRVEQVDPDEVPEALLCTPRRQEDLERVFWHYPPWRWLDGEYDFVAPLQVREVLMVYWWRRDNKIVYCDGYNTQFNPIPRLFGMYWVPEGAHPDWAAAQAAWTFCASPTAASLKAALGALQACPRSARALTDTFPWPLGALSADGVAPAYVEAANAGLFGDIDDWRAAERRWASIDTWNWAEVRAGDVLPFDASIARYGLPPQRGTSRSGGAVLPAALVADWHAARGLDQSLNFWLSFYPTQLPDVTDSAWANVPGSRSVSLLFRALRFWGWIPEVIRLFSELGQRRRVGAWHNWRELDGAALGAALAENSFGPGLLAVAAGALRGGSRVPISAERLAAIQAPNDRLAADLVLLRLSQIEPDPAAEPELRRILPLVETLADDLCVVSRAVPELHYDGTLRLLLSLTNPPIRSRVATTLAQRIAARPSGLTDPSQAFALELPLPPGTQAAVPEIPAVAATEQPQLLGDLHLTDFKGFATLDIQAPPRQWTILLGDNGVGKTSILRAIALSLLPVEVGQTLLTTYRSHSPLVRQGCAKAEVRVALSPVPDSSEEPWRFGCNVDRVEEGQRPGALFLVAYGARRGAVQNSKAKLDFGALGAVNTLFSEEASLIHPDAWLTEWKLRALERKNGDQRFFDAILKALVALLPGVESLEVSSEGTRVYGPGLEGVPLSALSDGYLTTAGWILDLVARWVDWARDRKMTVDKDFASKMTGLVLIDEIDLHLHPQWQRKLIATLREHFPNLSFVATTHNPVSLLGARPGELCVLRREGAEVSAIFRDIPPGTHAERVLTGDWFGLVSTLDAETLWLLEEQRLLLRERPDDPRVLEIRRLLEERLGRPSTSLEKLVESVAAEVLEEENQSLTPQKLALARARILERVRQRRAAP